MRLAITGANSSVGLNLLGHVIRQGDTDVVACVRSDRAASTLPTSPRIIPRIVTYDDEAGLAESLGGSDCLVHLAGILIEWKGARYETANVATTESVVAAARHAGVGHLVLVSVIGATTQSANRYLRSKGLAEEAVAESGISATIIRTPILLGPGTAGASALVRTVRAGKARMLGGGSYTMRPLDVDDLSRAILGVCRTGQPGVARHDLVGPEPITYRELVTRAARIVGRETSLRSTPLWVAKLGAAVRSRITGGGITPTVIDVITMNEEVDRNAAADLGVNLTPLSDTLQKVLPEPEKSA